jgi:hypothetical protein
MRRLIIVLSLLLAPWVFGVSAWWLVAAVPAGAAILWCEITRPMAAHGFEPPPGYGFRR